MVLVTALRQRGRRGRAATTAVTSGQPVIRPARSRWPHSCPCRRTAPRATPGTTATRRCRGSRARARQQSVGGGCESDMPGFGSVLSDDKIRGALASIRSTRPGRERRGLRHQADPRAEVQVARATERPPSYRPAGVPSARRPRTRTCAPGAKGGSCAPSVGTRRTARTPSAACVTPATTRSSVAVMTSPPLPPVAQPPTRCATRSSLPSSVR